MELLIRHLDEIDRAAQQIADRIATGNPIITLTGDLGAGKTTLTRALAQKLGVEEPVSSPTYSLVNTHTFTDARGERRPLYHIDLYRLRDLEEALDIGIEEYLYRPGAVCLIEWPELIEPLLPSTTLRISLEIIEDGARKIIFL